MWRIRSSFWNALLTLKFRRAKPLVIPVPVPDNRPIVAVPFASAFPRIPIRGLITADHVPRDERQTVALMFCKFQAWLVRVFSPMQSGLPAVVADPEVALDQAYRPAMRRCFPTPLRAPGLDGGIDLGTMAVASPYSCYLQQDDDGRFHWDLSLLDSFECHAGLRSPAAQVEFELDPTSGTLRAVRIDSDLGVSVPTDSDWEVATQLAMCAVTTHLSLVRHFNWIHLVAGQPLAIATRNRLSASHPLRRLLQPHTHSTQASNQMVTIVQMEPGGDFENMFSFTHSGMCELMEATVSEYDLRTSHPALDTRMRGVAGSSVRSPALRNRESLADVIEAHVRRYLSIYYPSDGAVSGDSSLGAWTEDLAESIPNGVRELVGSQPTFEGMVALVSTCIYLTTVEHEIVGSGVWDYQLWSDAQPTRVHRNGQRPPLDVYSRVVKANFNLNVHRTPLMSDFSPLALDAKGAAAFRQFHQDLASLQSEMDQEPSSSWRIEPRRLKANINA